MNIQVWPRIVEEWVVGGSPPWALSDTAYILSVPRPSFNQLMSQACVYMFQAWGNNYCWTKNKMFLLTIKAVATPSSMFFCYNTTHWVCWFPSVALLLLLWDLEKWGPDIDQPKTLGTAFAVNNKSLSLIQPSCVFCSIPWKVTG